jgi:hypothetical protein
MERQVGKLPLPLPLEFVALAIPLPTFLLLVPRESSLSEVESIAPSPIDTSVCTLGGVTRTEESTAAVKYEVSL